MIYEIQLSTILYHAWSEVAHDIIYNPPYGILEGAMETPASFEARSAPLRYSAFWLTPI
jgi:ppGpp synthetase/RelA/SpoT-type nucleotidyltranferase